MSLRPGLRHHYREYRKVSEARFEQGEGSVREEQKQSDRAGSGAGARRGKARVARHVAGPGGADPEAATKFPADGPRADGHLHAASEHPRFLPLRSGSRAAADPSADGPTVDGTGPTAAAGLPTAGPTATASLPADDSGSAEHLLAAVQHPALLRSGRVAGRPVPC